MQCHCLFLKVKWLTFNKLNFEKWLLTALKINRLPKVHIVDRYLAAVAQLGVKNDGLGLDFFMLGSSARHEVTPFPTTVFRVHILWYARLFLRSCIPCINVERHNDG